MIGPVALDSGRMSPAIFEKKPVIRLGSHPPWYPDGGPRSAGLRKCLGKIRGVQKEASKSKLKWRLLLPGASEPRLAVLTRQDFRWSFKPLKRPEQPEHSCRLQLLHGPISAEPYREKTRPLRPRRSWFAPAEARQLWRGLGWRRRVLPPGPNGLLRRLFISIAGEPAPPI